MKTAVIQSAGPRRQEWVHTCLQSVRGWARTVGDYFFEEDQFFTRVEPSHRERLSQHADKAPLSDLARLLWARQLFARGYERVIWLDSDVYVFDPAGFSHELPTHTAFCHETWFDRRIAGFNRFRFAVNNAVMTLCDGLTFRRYLSLAVERVENDAARTRLAIGPELLSTMHYEEPLPLIRHVPTLASEVQRSLVENTSIVRGMMRWHGHRACAAHLCVSHAAAPDLVARAIGQIAADSGRRLNSHVTEIATSYFHGLRPYAHVRRADRVLAAVSHWLRSLLLPPSRA